MRLAFLVAAALSVSLSAAWSAEPPDKNTIIDIPPPPVRTLTGATYPPLKDVLLAVGETVRLDREIDDGRPPAEGCMDKPSASARFCLDPVDWPEPLQPATANGDIVHKGRQAIIRYDQGRSSQANVLFPASAFVGIVEALKNRYGPPTEQEMQIREVPGDDKVVNTVVRWKSRSTEGDKTAILEVRAFDDLRHPHPDRTHGMLWLYREGAVPVFRHFNTIDMMVLRQRRIGQWPPQGSDSPKPSPPQ